MVFVAIILFVVVVVVVYFEILKVNKQKNCYFQIFGGEKTLMAVLGDSKASN